MNRNSYIDQEIVYSILENKKSQHVSVRKLTDLYNNLVEGSNVSKSKMYTYVRKEMELR
jgi:uncharacterized protein YfkK (UPF0435 family)